MKKKVNPWSRKKTKVTGSSKLKSTTEICLLFMELKQCCGEGHKSAVIYIMKDEEKSILRVKQ